MGADKYDIKRDLRALYSPPADRFVDVDVPPQRYLAYDGAGDPNTAPAYQDALTALYPVAYALKFESKTRGRDFVVAPLEGLWRADDPAVFTTRRDKRQWQWTMMIAIPDWITAADVENAKGTVERKKQLAAVRHVRVSELHEGPCVQILHVGSFDDEGPTLARLHDVHLPEHGLTFNGDHHEIYLSDPRRTEPARLKTVLRQPVRRIIDAPAAAR